MDYFEENFKDEFEGQDSNLPDGFGWEDMKAGIQEKMDDQKAVASKKWWSLLLLLFVAGCGSWMTFNAIYGEQKEEVNQEIEKPIVKSNAEDIDKYIVNNKKKSTIVENIQSKKLEKNTTSLNGLITQIDQVQKSNVIENKQRKVNSNIAASKSNSNRYFKNEEFSASTNVQRTRTGETELQKNFTEINQVRAINSFIQLPTIHLSKLTFNRNIKFLPRHQKIVEQIKSDTPRKDLSMRWGLASGAINWLEMDQKDINYDFLSGYPGFTIRPSIELNFSKKQSVELAYQFSSLNQLFEYEGTRNYKQELENAVVGKLVNSLTGSEISETRRDTFVNASQRQKAVHYNKHQFQSLQLNYGITFKLNDKTNLRLYLGGEYAFTVNSKGLELNSDEIIQSFDKNNSDLKGGRFATRFAANYEFSLSEKIGLNLGIHGSKYFGKWGRTDRKGPLFYGIQAGIKSKI